MTSSTDRPESRSPSPDEDDVDMKSEVKSEPDDPEAIEVDVVNEPVDEIPPPPKRSSGFSIDDILSDRFAPAASAKSYAFVRPWDLPRNTVGPADNHSFGIRIGRDHKKTKNSPLDALFKMASKTFEGFEKPDSKSDSQSSHSQSSNNGSANGNLKKKRKSRTAFTNHQVFELEKRFLYQKYLSPADRDEIAQSLGLSNAQVITWFQNRRAKLKRDIEELKKDVTATRIHTLQNSIYVGSVGNVEMLRAKFMRGQKI